MDEKGSENRVFEQPSGMVKELGWQTREYRKRVNGFCHFYRVVKVKDGWES